MKYKSKFLAFIVLGMSFNKICAMEEDAQLQAALEASKKEYEKEKKRRQDKQEEEKKIIEESRKEYEKEKKRREALKQSKEKNLGIKKGDEENLKFSNANVTIIKTSDEKNNCFFHSTYNANPAIWEVIVGEDVLENARTQKTMNPVRKAFFEKLKKEDRSYKDDEGQYIEFENCLKEGILLPPLFNILNDLTGVSFKFYTVQESNEFMGEAEKVIEMLNAIHKKVSDSQFKEEVLKIIKNIQNRPDDKGLLMNASQNLGAELIWWNNGEIYNMKEFEELGKYIEEFTKKTKKVKPVYKSQKEDSPETVKILLYQNHYSTIKDIKLFS